MFEKKTYLFNDHMGVCYVEDVTKLVTAQKKEVLYYVLRPVYSKEKLAYIPVENHSANLRELMTVEQAEKELFSETELLSLAEELGYVDVEEETMPESTEPTEGTDDPQSAGDGRVIVAGTTREELEQEKAQEQKRLSLQYKMADTLPFEERSHIYHLGEIEFVLRQDFARKVEEAQKKEARRKAREQRAAQKLKMAQNSEKAQNTTDTGSET
ncbi:MAG: hypothetical protein K6E75_10735 [Lachnospiraceae bacterium]|nr:hypothetical protein [Lachnospiraceae bacterium]